MRILYQRSGSTLIGTAVAEDRGVAILNLLECVMVLPQPPMFQRIRLFRFGAWKMTMKPSAPEIFRAWSVRV